MVEDKLQGNDFDAGLQKLSVKQQVNKAIAAATSPENLSKMYIGWGSVF
jgi:phosphatidylinositol kinase/protein kinase (PI-3  family)